MSGKNKLSGKYSFTGQDQIKFEIGGPFGVSMVSKYSLSGDKLFLTIEGRDFTYHRTGTLRPNCDLPACGESRNFSPTADLPPTLAHEFQAVYKDQ